jgi:hypothetical protein
VHFENGVFKYSSFDYFCARVHDGLQLSYKRNPPPPPTSNSVSLPYAYSGSFKNQTAEQMQISSERGRQAAVKKGIQINVGMKIGSIEILEVDSRVRCKCGCGDEFTYSISSIRKAIRTGTQDQLRCKKCIKADNRALEIGTKVGRCTVVRRSRKTKYWVLRCVCGNELELYASYIKQSIRLERDTCCRECKRKTKID